MQEPSVRTDKYKHYEIILPITCNTEDDEIALKLARAIYKETFRMNQIESDGKWIFGMPKLKETSRTISLANVQHDLFNTRFDGIVDKVRKVRRKWNQ